MEKSNLPLPDPDLKVAVVPITDIEAHVKWYQRKLEIVNSRRLYKAITESDIDAKAALSAAPNIARSIGNALLKGMGWFAWLLLQAVWVVYLFEHPLWTVGLGSRISISHATTTASAPTPTIRTEQNGSG